MVVPDAAVAELLRPGVEAIRVWMADTLNEKRATDDDLQHEGDLVWLRPEGDCSCGGKVLGEPTRHQSAQQGVDATDRSGAVRDQVVGTFESPVVAGLPCSGHTVSVAFPLVSRISRHPGDVDHPFRFYATRSP